MTGPRGGDAPQTSPLWRPEEIQPSTERDHVPEIPPNSRLWREDENTLGPATQVSNDELPQVALWRVDEGHRDVDSSIATTDQIEVSTEDSVLWRPEESKSPGPEAIHSKNGSRRIRNRKTIRRRLSWRRLGALAALAIAAALVADLAYAVTGLVDTLEQVKTELRAFRNNLDDGDLDRAGENLAAAAKAADRAEALTNHPGVLLTSFIPDIRAARTLAETGETGTSAAQAALRAAQSLGVDPQGGVAASLYRDGVVDFSAIQRAEPAVQRVEKLLIDAREGLEGTPSPLLDPVASALSNTLKEVEELADSAHKAVALLDRLPSLLGADEQRRYLLAFQTPSEARATGGLIGLYGILKADGGRLELGRIGPAGNIDPEGPIDSSTIPTWFADSYGPQSALEDIRQANVSPNFPAVSQVFIQNYVDSTSRSVDGVLAMDPVAMSNLMNATGNLEVDGTTLTPESVETLLLRDSYLRFPDQASQTSFLKEVVAAFWSRIHNGDFDESRFATELGETVQTQHLKIFTVDTTNQDVMEELGASGALDSFGPNLQMVFHNNYAANKVDYYLDRNIETSIQLSPDGRAKVETIATLQNNAPPGPPSLLLGPSSLSPSDPPGLNRMLLSFLLPSGSEIKKFESEGASIEPLVYYDEDYPVAWDVLEINPGTSETAEIEYEIHDAVSTVTDGSIFTMTMFPQAAVRSDSFSLTVEAPYGFLLRDVEMPGSQPRSIAEISGALDAPRTFHFQLVSQ